MGIKSRAVRAGSGHAVKVGGRAGTEEVSGDSVPRSVARNPDTALPAPAALASTPLDERRDVAARLDEMTAARGDSVEMDLLEAWKTAHRSSPEYLSREEDYFVAAISLLIERHQWGTRLFNDTTTELSGQGDEGRFQNAVDVVNSLRLTRRLPSGGEVEARWVARAAQQLRESSTKRYVQSSELVLSGRLPLLRGSGEAADESLTQAERDLVYAARDFERFRREHLVSIAQDYFNLIELEAQIANQVRQLKSLQQFEEGARARVQAGRVSEFERVIAESQVLIATSSLASLRESLVLAVDRFKVRLGLPVGAVLSIKPLTLALVEPDMSLERATELAVEYRLDLQNSRDRLEDSRRAVRIARNGLLPDLDLGGDVRVPTSSGVGVGTVGLDQDDLNWSASLTLSLPLDRRQEGLALRRSVIRLEQSRRAHAASVDRVVVDARGAVRAVELARLRLTLAERSVEINRRRLDEQQLKIDEIQPQQIVDTENQLLDAENGRDRAATDLRVAVLNLMLTTDTLRVGQDGVIESGE